ncbi:MAG TPA: M15 family metallopeptidase [Microbacteriaceae bacterium]|nr:M15 family metallopeptidase [Microbacteriaceae bacterium]
MRLSKLLALTATVILCFCAPSLTACATEEPVLEEATAAASETDTASDPDNVTKEIETEAENHTEDEKKVAEDDSANTAEKETAPKFSIDDPMSIWVVSNKHRPLDPIDFEPTDLVYPEGVDNSNGQPLRVEASQAVEELVAQAAADGIYIGLTSAYRSFWLQESLYHSYINRDGQALADRYSARPGHSEHQTGLTVDFDDFSGCGLSECFESTPAGIWLKDNAASYGFIMRYPQGYEHITGFMYEPWHYRYVGTQLATDMAAQNVATLEEWFGLPPAPDYL